jgi:hypothetical protein
MTRTCLPEGSLNRFDEDRPIGGDRTKKMSRCFHFTI